MPASRDRPGRRRVLKSLCGVGVGALTGAGSWGYLYERHQVVTTSREIALERLPPALEGLRIALLTDFHRSRTVPEGLVRRAVTLAKAAQPDLIVLGGDYVTWGDRQYVEPAAAALEGLAAPYGVHAVLGNHDDDRAMPAALTRKGYDVLRDARTSVAVRGEQLELIGVRFWTRKAGDIGRLLRGATGFPILLAHDPRRLTEAAALGLPLVLSGHTHGGQVVLPGVGAFAARKFPTAAGLTTRDDTTLFVSRGVGTVYVPIRIHCPPEVAILTLVRRRPKPRDV
jgi:predicted MPP superfamily phosphohydrolase